MTGEATPGGLEVVTDPRLIAHIAWATGKIGVGHELTTPAEQAEFAHALAENTHPLTITNAADCIDERRTLRLASMNHDDPELLEARVISQLPGGTYLASTKAAVAAGAEVVRGAHSFEDAYNKIEAVLDGMGYEDAGHRACGASAMVEQSVSRGFDVPTMFETIQVLNPLRAEDQQLLEENEQRKQRLLVEGFYGEWTASAHEARLQERVPHNFSLLQDDPSDQETHGHHASGVYFPPEGQGLAKNALIAQTGREAFAYSAAFAARLARDLAGTAEERQRLYLAFLDDALQVSGQLVAGADPAHAYPGLAVFA